MSKFCIVFLGFVILLNANIFSQTNIELEPLVKNDSIFYDMIDDTDFSIGWSVLNIGFLGNTNSNISGDLVLKPSLYTNYKRIYLIAEAKFGTLGKIKNDIGGTQLNKGNKAKQTILDVSLGYDIRKNNKKIIPYFGYTWNYLQIYDNDDLVEDFYNNSVSFNISFMSTSVPSTRNEIFGGRVVTDMLASFYFTLGYIPYNFSKELSGSYYYFNLGVYFNHKFNKNLKTKEK